MEPSTPNPFLNSKVIIVFVSFLIASAVLGGFLSQRFEIREQMSLETPVLPVVAAREMSSGVVVGTSPEVRTIFGTVKSISLDTLVVSVQGVPAVNNPFFERQIKITNETKITTFVSKDSKVFSDETAVYEKKIKETTALSQIVLAPEPFIRKEVSASGIRVGDTIRVMSGVDIATKKEFVAEEIQFYPQEVSQIKK